MAGNIGATLFGEDMWAKLALNVETKPLLDDEAFVQILRDVQADPNKMMQHSQDPRMMKVFSVLLSSIATASPPPSAAETAATMDGATTTPSASAASVGTARHAAAAPANGRDGKKQKPDFSLLPESERAEKESEWEKEAGNVAYKAKQFETALQHYSKAMELAPDNMALLTNRAAVKLETGDIEGCIEDCQKAITENKERLLHTDFKIIARAHARIAAAHMKSGNYTAAVSAYQDSLLEHKDDKVQDKLLDAKRKLRIQEEQAYVDPELSKTAREDGNNAFRKGDFPTAVKLYTEAIKRNPTDPAPYSNRAAAYTKLGEFPHGLKDCEKAIELDPKYIKAYSRKAAIHFFMKEYHKCVELYQKGLEVDPNNAEMRNGLNQTMMAINRQSNSGEVDEQQVQHAMADPEIQAILMDPMVQSVLKQLQEDPSSANEVLRNPQMAAKIQKLIASGVMRTSA
mmetsp:Transcript_10289/g.21610  ORF Transcript_10289/g.21610 Transcript_10289/m.21610 type:complete len:458 (+) Transcript_10289:60-1433(+)|eukprot:CAMPEP_0185844074 /NCGR_PEP_ID=MMETSP1354-20130828/373_1 /TAXON_ID=708628 /ORGANISM="Erythrolobus madagascarensis, Strain CCMP3276" /LENGTH=457 /DNA_ID=CAMNT_0028543683 /DNA_START=48 /DNA_END=1421 /DNA_ORIENTATION=+